MKSKHRIRTAATDRRAFGGPRRHRFAGSLVEILEGRQMLAAGGVTFPAWQNPTNHHDVNNDKTINALDALLIINDLSVRGTHSVLPSAAMTTGGIGPNTQLTQKPKVTTYLDVNGDNMVSPIDVLRVVNKLNAQTNGFPDQLLQISLSTTDMQGNAITQVTAGVDFKLVASVQDLRPTGQGVGSAYLDVSYDSALVSVDPVVPSAEYDDALNNISLDSPGEINDKGGASFVALGTAKRVLWTAVVHANSPGSLDFIADEADLPLAFPDFVIGQIPEADLPLSQVEYLSTSIEILPSVLPTLSVADVLQINETPGGTTATFTVTLSQASADPVRVTYNTSNGSAAAPVDYLATSGTLTFPANVTTQTISVTINDDQLAEATETFFVNLSSPQNAIISDGRATGFILDDELPVTLAIDDVVVSEGDVLGTVNAVFTVTLSVAQLQNVTVGFATSDNTAVDGQDYTGQSGDLTFLPGDTTKTVTVPILSDLTDELDETFFVNLSSATGVAFIADPQGIGTITDDDQEGLRISDYILLEGDAGTTNAIFTVNLSAAINQTFSVTYSTADDTATLADNDYVAASGTLTFAPNDPSKTITVQVNGDLTPESTETFLINLLNVSAGGPAIIDGTGIGTIVDDDTQGNNQVRIRVEALDQNGSVIDLQNPLSINDPFTINVYVLDLRPAPDNTGVFQAYIDVNYSSTLVSPTGPIDHDGPDPNNPTPYVNNPSGSLATPGLFDEAGAFDGLTPLGPAEQLLFTVPMVAQFAGTATFDPNIANLVGHEIYVYGDLTPVPFSAIDFVSATVEIGSNSLSIGDVTITEGNSGTTNAIFTVTRFKPDLAVDAVVAYSTADGTALSGVDYLAASGTLTFTGAETTKLVTVPIIGDTLDEFDETFFVNLSGATGAAVSDAQGLGTILDDDAPPTISVSDATAFEGDALTFTVSLSAASAKPITVVYVTSNGTAIAPADYAAASGTLTFAANVTQLTINVGSVADLEIEPDESFNLTLSAPTNATLLDGVGIGTIKNVLPSGVTGYVYVDTDNDGFKDPDEVGIAGVLITLSGGGVANRTVTTDVNGAYSLIGLTPGTYTITETQPGFYFDGIDTPGTPPPTLPTTDDQFNGIVLTSGVLAQNYNFGEVGLRPEFVSAFFNRRAYLASSIITGEYGNPSSTANIDLTKGDVWVSLDGGWQGQRNFELFFLSSEGTATLRLYDYNVNLLATSPTQTDHAQLNYIGIPGQTMFLRVSGTNPDVTLKITETISVANIVVNEPNTGTTNAVFTVKMSGPVASNVVVTYGTSNGSAIAPADFAATSGQITFTPGTLSQTITVPVKGDTLDEVNETFSLNLSAGANVAIAQGQGIATIVDNDPLPTMSIASVAVTEPATGVTNAVFNVALSAASGKTVIVVYSTANGSATSPADYNGTSGTLTFAPGVISIPVPISVKADQLAENTETFFVNLSAPVNAVVSTGQATGTIINFVQTAPASASFASANGAAGASASESVGPSASADEVEYAAADDSDRDLYALAASAPLVAASCGESSTRQKATDQALEDDSYWLEEALVA